MNKSPNTNNMMPFAILTQAAASRSPSESPTSSPSSTPRPSAAPASAASTTAPSPLPSASTNAAANTSPANTTAVAQRPQLAKPSQSKSRKRKQPDTPSPQPAQTAAQHQPRPPSRAASYGPVKRRKTKWQKPASQPIMRAAVWEIRYGRARIVETALRYGIPLRTLRRYRDISKAGGTGYEEVDGKGVQFKDYIDDQGEKHPPLPPRTVKKYRTGFKWHLFEEDVLETTAPRRVERVQPGRGAALTAAALAADAAATARKRNKSSKYRRNDGPAPQQQQQQHQHQHQEPIPTNHWDTTVALAKHALDAALLARSQATGAAAMPFNMKPFVPQPGQYALPVYPAMNPSVQMAHAAPLMYPHRALGSSPSLGMAGQFNGQMYAPHNQVGRLPMAFSPMGMRGYPVFQQPHMQHMVMGAEPAAAKAPAPHAYGQRMGM